MAQTQRSRAADPAAEAVFSGKEITADNTRHRQQPQLLDGRAVGVMTTAPHRCASCGCIGRLSLADPRPDDDRPVLRLAWGTAGARLLCALCRDGGAS